MCQKTSGLLGLGRSHLYEMAPPGTYAYFVRVATQKLSGAEFGGWQGFDADGTPNFAKDKYDKNFWQDVYDAVWKRVLQLNDGKQPADAVDAILDQVGKWRIDCDNTVQIANLYAIRQVIGAAAFDLRATSKDPSRAKPNMLLRPRDSDGLKTVLHFGRDKPADQWRKVLSYDPNRIKPDPTDPKNTRQLVGPFEYDAGYFYAPGLNVSSSPEDTTTYLVGAATSGSRVRWTNLWVNLDHPFRHENCVKLEYDLFAAGGLGNILTGNEFNRSQLENELRVGNETIQNNIFIDEVEVFAQN